MLRVKDLSRLNEIRQTGDFEHGWFLPDWSHANSTNP